MPGCVESSFTHTQTYGRQLLLGFQAVRMIPGIAKTFQKRTGRSVQQDGQLRLSLHDSHNAEFQQAKPDICCISDFLEKDQALLKEVNRLLRISLKPRQ